METQQADSRLFQTTYGDTKKQIDPQSYSMGYSFLQDAQQQVAEGNIDQAGYHLKQFANFTGNQVKDLEKGWFGGKKTSENMKYIRGLSDSYNNQTLKEFYFEARKRNYLVDAANIKNIYDKAREASTTPEASVEVSSILNKALSRMKYIDNLTNVNDTTISELDAVKRKYFKESQLANKRIEDNISHWNKYTSKGVREVAGGALSLVTGSIDLAGDIAGLLFNTKSPQKTTEMISEKLGIDPESPWHKAGMLAAATGTMAAGAVMAGTPIGWGTLAASALSAILIDKVGAFVQPKIYGALGSFDIGEEKRSQITNVATAGVMYGSHGPISNLTGRIAGLKPKSTRISGKGSPGGMGESFGPEVSDGPGGRGPKTPPGSGGSPMETSLGRQNSEIIIEGNNKGNQLAKWYELYDFGNGTSVVEEVSPQESQSQGQQSQAQAQSQQAQSQSQAQYTKGKSFDGAYIERSGNKEIIKDVNVNNVEKGAANTANYDAEIGSDGKTIVMERDLSNVADVINKKANIIEQEPSVIDHGLDVIPDEGGLEISSAEPEVAAFGKIIEESLPVTEPIARMAERGSDALITRMAMSEDSNIKNMGTALNDIRHVAQMLPGEEGEAVRSQINKELLDTKEVFFDLIGISEDPVNGIDFQNLENKTYTGDIAKGAINESKQLLKEKFNPNYELFNKAVDSDMINRPAEVKTKVAELNDIVLKLNEVDENNNLIYEPQIKKIADKLVTSEKTVVNDMTKLLQEDTRVGERISAVKRALRNAARQYDTDSIKKSDASVLGSQDRFVREIYDTFSKTSDDIFESALERIGQDPSIYKTTNQTYADYAKARAPIIKYLTDNTIDGQAVYSKFVSNPERLVEILRFADKQEIKAGSNLAKLLQLIKIEGIKSILNITDDGQIIFKMENKKRFSFGKIKILKSLLNKKQIADLEELAIMGSKIAELKRGRENPSGTKTLDIIVEGVSGTALNKQIDTIIKSEGFKSGTGFAKNLAKILKKLKLSSLNKGILGFNASVKALTFLTDYFTEAQAKRVMSNIVELTLSNAIKAFNLREMSKTIMMKGKFDSLKLEK